MLTVGDLIIGCRELLPDLPRTLPAIGNLSAIPVAAISSLSTGPYNLVVTAANRWGETIASSPLTLTVGAGQGIQVTGPLLATIPGATSIKVYYAISGQPFMQFMQSSLMPFTITGPGSIGTPPTRSTAFYPDSDGNRFSTFTLYRWLNEALVTASSLAGGLPDTSGVPAVASQGMYYIPGNWKRLWDLWFNGFPVAYAGAKDMFYRNFLTGISFLANLQYNAERMIIELQPQPNQSGGSTTLSAPVNIGDQALSLNSSATFVLPLGLARIGDINGQYEIVDYSQINGPTLAGCVRGLGGTIESAWPIGTPINECNIRINGLRLFTNQFQIGQSMSGIAIPPDWQMPLIDYMLNKARQGEQSAADYQAKLKEFAGFIKESCRGNAPVAGPRQVGGASNPSDSYPSRGGFGIIVP